MNSMFVSYVHKNADNGNYGYGSVVIEQCPMLISAKEMEELKKAVQKVFNEETIIVIMNFRRMEVNDIGNPV